MKKGVLFGLVLFSLMFLLLMRVVSAGNCGDSQTIMKLFSPSNSHGALWNDANYTYDICYDNVFGVQGNGNHLCSGTTNKVLGLFSINNSHAEIPILNNYTNNVCYGDLTCTAEPNRCSSGGKMALALYSNNNSHITDPNYMPSGIVSWWRFDDDTANDYLGRNNGVLKNGVGVVDSKVGRGLNLDGTNDYVQINDSNSLDLTSHTTEAWFKINSLPVGNGSWSILAKGEDEFDTIDHSNYLIGLLRDEIIMPGILVLQCGTEEYKVNGHKLLLFPITDSYTGRYVHVACTLEGINWKIYIDGVDRTSESTMYDYHTVLSNRLLPVGFVPAPTTSPLFIGAAQEGPTSLTPGKVPGDESGFFPGIIDEVAIYNRSLTAEEVQHRYNMGMYEKKICCSSGVSSVSGLHWTNMIGTPINKTRIGARVKAVVPGTSLAGKSINYEIWKSAVWWWDNQIATSSTRGELIWRAGRNKTDYIEGGNYYFKAGIVGESLVNSQDNNNPYGTLEVTSGENVPPVANITSPLDKQMYFLLENLNFSQSSYDVDSYFNWTWDFGDGTSISGNSQNMINYNTFHVYNTPGQKNIRLAVTDEEGAMSSDKISILIINSTHILAYIDEPAWGGFVGAGLTKFNATSTYAITVGYNSTGISNITCIAGPCPSRTAGCPPPAINYPTCQINVLGTPNPTGFETIWFGWVFDNNALSNYNGTGTTGAIYRRHFEPGFHTARLTARID